MDKIKFFLKCNKEIWDYIKPIVSKYNYIYSTSTLSPHWDKYPYLTYECDGMTGILSNTENVSENDKIVGIAEFIDIIKNKNNHIKGIPLKPGMIIETESSGIYIAVPTNNTIAFANISLGGILYNNELELADIKIIRNISNNSNIYNGEILWKRM